MPAPSWHTFHQWLDTVDAHGLSGNMVTVLGYSTIRMNVMGPDGARTPTEEEKAALKEHIHEAMDAGSFGMSVGLDYEPGIFSGTRELLEMSRELKADDGILFVHDANTESVKVFLGHPKATLGNDTFVFSTDSTVAYDPESPGNKPNPNTYCGFIKFLTELGGEDRAQMIYKLTGRPAELLHLTKRGTLAVGKQADILVIDWDHLKTNENVLDPVVYPEGIEQVLVNGTAVIRDGRHTGALPGGVIRRQDR